MKYPKDLVGLQFGRLTVISQTPNDRPYRVSLWNCQCVCGNSRVVQRSALVCGVQVSCGCFMRMRVKETHTTHGLHRHSAYGTWKAMIDRCYNPDSKDFKDYGGRGIQVCDEWRDLAGFVAGMGPKEKGQSIDRLDENGDYEPGNCRWTDALGQGEHKRNNAIITRLGSQRHIASVWREAGIKESTFYNRLNAGMTPDEAASLPVRKHNATAVIEGQERTLVEWAKIAGVDSATMRNRVKAGIVGKALLAPSRSRKLSA